jgi:Mg2+ and Co2+ transporter CorA
LHLLNLKQIKSRLLNHRRNLASLADFQHSASTLVSSLYRSFEPIDTTNWIQIQILKMMDQRNDHAMQRNGEILEQLTLQTNRESRLMTELSEKMATDSQIMRILTSVAIFYLPPSLIAVSGYYHIWFCKPCTPQLIILCQMYFFFKCTGLLHVAKCF